MYTVDDFFYSPEKVSVLLPQEVIMLLLFDGEHNFVEVAKNMTYVFDIKGISQKQAETLLKNSLKNIEERINIQPLIQPATQIPLSILNKTKNRYPAPSHFIIPKDKIIFNPSDLRLSSPLSVNYNVMTSCSFKCKYCYHPLVPVNELISLERLKVIFKELKMSGCESVMLTGGDPMLRPDIDDLMEALHDVGLYYALSTKSIISDERIKRSEILFPLKSSRQIGSF